jgi:hypothetical protein
MPRPNLSNISHIQQYEYEDEDDINMQQKIADVYQLQHPPKKQENLALKKHEDSPYELFKLAHAPVKGPVTQNPVAVVLNQNNMKVVDDQLVHETGSPIKNNMQINSNFHPDAQRAQLQKPPPPRVVGLKDTKNFVNNPPPLGQVERPLPVLGRRTQNDNVQLTKQFPGGKVGLNENLVDSRVSGELSRHTRSDMNRGRDVVDNGGEETYHEGEQEDEEEDEEEDDINLRGHIGIARKLLYEKSLPGECEDYRVVQYFNRRHRG